MHRPEQFLTAYNYKLFFMACKWNLRQKIRGTRLTGSSYLSNSVHHNRFPSYGSSWRFGSHN